MGFWTSNRALPPRDKKNTTMVSAAFPAALLLLVGALCGLPAPCLGVLRDLGLTADFVDSEHVARGGSCADGCVRTVVDAVAISLGEVPCDLGGLRVENLLDHTTEDVLAGALTVVHYCSNSDGELMYQARETKEKRARFSRRARKAVWRHKKIK